MVSPAVVEIRGAVRKALENLSAGDAVLVACSGGADSLALAWAISVEAPKLALRVIGVTIDHQLQSSSSLQAERVLDQMRAMGIKEVEAIRVKVEMTDGLEASARRARYEALNEIADRKSAVKIFLGHTQDDQAETVLLGLARGSGTRSLSGMAGESGRYLRPLLGITRDQTLSLCRENGLEVWNDPHNQDPRFLRVRLRNQALPILEETIGPGVAPALARSAALLRDDADALDEWARREFTSIEWSSMEVAHLAGLPKAVRTRILRLAAYAAGAPSGSILAEHVAAIEALVTSWHGQGEVSLPGGVKVGRLSGRLSLLPAQHHETEI
ncbi:MAG: tRNA lysidine(34) synthetase TilS [Actinomycetota bacterium]